MKVTHTLGLLLLGIGALSCAVVFAQGQETAKQPASKPGLDPLIQSAVPRDNPYWQVYNGADTVNFQHQSAQLAKQYVKTEKEDEKKDLKKKLADVLAKQFDAQVNQQQKELADLERQIANLKALLKKRLDAKTTIIDRRMDQLIQDAEGLGWTAPGGGHSGYVFDPNVFSPRAKNP
jgi:flagellar motility protein MotE (MotC chaperone)